MADVQTLGKILEQLQELSAGQKKLEELAEGQRKLADGYKDLERKVRVFLASLFGNSWWTSFFFPCGPSPRLVVLAFNLRRLWTHLSPHYRSRCSLPSVSHLLPYMGAWEVSARSLKVRLACFIFSVL
jgi:hypothetical protein